MTNSIEELQRQAVLKLLEEYNVPATLTHTNGPEIYSKCCLHGGNNETALNINYQKMIYYCRTHCGGGTIVDLICKMESVDRKRAMEKLQRLMDGHKIQKQEFSNKWSNLECNGLEVSIEDNPDLIKIMEESRPLLSFRNFQPETLQFFDIRIGQIGSMYDRVIIPIQNCVNKLVGLKIRNLSEYARTRYYMYPEGLSKSRLLFNYSNIADKDICFVVEGEFKAMKLYEMGFPSVAIMGSSIGPIQCVLLSTFSIIYCFKDGDDAGDKFESSVINGLKTIKFKGVLKSIQTPPGLDPDDLSGYEILCLMKNSIIMKDK